MGLLSWVFYRGAAYLTPDTSLGPVFDAQPTAASVRKSSISGLRLLFGLFGAVDDLDAS